MRQRLMLFLAGLFLSIGASVAQVTVKGTVLSADDGEPLPGAKVKLFGEKSGTVTDINGIFTINVPNNNARLEVSYSGMVKQVVRARSGMRVSLENENYNLDEVMVVAYGTAKKSAFTGTAAVVDAASLEKVQAVNVAEALKGKVSGVQIVQSTGQPGTEPSIRIRGITSYSGVSGANAPLYVVDGSPFDGDLNTIAPSDIESVTVLKEAAASALYGARGANGVIIITTKTGKNTGNGVINVDAKWGASHRQLPDYEYISSPAGYYEQWYKGLYNYAVNEFGMSPGRANVWANQNLIDSESYGLAYNIYIVPQGQSLIGMNGKLNPNATLGNVIMNPSTGEQFMLYPDNWIDAIYKTSLRQEYTVSTSASNDKGSFYVSGNYLNQDGITPSSAYERFSSLFKADYQLKPWLRANVSVNFEHHDADYVSEDGESNVGNMFAMAQMAPVYPLYIRDAQGNILQHEEAGIALYDYGDGSQMGISRPYLSLSNGLADHLVNVNHYSGNSVNATASFDIRFLNDFRFTSLNSAYVEGERGQATGNPWFGTFNTESGHVWVSHTRLFSANFQQLLNWHHLFDDTHDVEVMLGHEYYDRRSSSLNADKTSMFDPRIAELEQAVVAGSGQGSSTSRYNTEGFFGRALYNYDERYFGEASFRLDGTSRFQRVPKDNRWGKFWSLSGGWLLQKENWFQNLNATWVDELKLKASYGEQGNDRIPSYAYTTTYSFSNSDGQVTLNPNNKGNSNITWETCAELNVGAEFSFWNGRLSGSVDYYSRETRDMLTWVSLPASSGFSGLYDNIGRMRNQGVEVELNGDIIRSKELTWSAHLNFTSNHNEITKIYDNNKTMRVDGVEGYYSGDYYYGEGVPIYTFFTFKYAGVSDKGEALYYKNIYLTDANGDEVLDEKGYPIITGVTTTNTTADADYYLTGSAMPDAYGGFGTSLAWKGWDLSVDFSYQLGGLVYDTNYASAMDPMNRGGAIHVDALNAWTPENPNNEIPRWQFNDRHATATSDRFLTDASYLNIQNIQLGYTLPKSLTSRFHLQRLRVYAVADNVWLWSKRQGLDPRQSISGGTTNTSYSPIRTISGGVSITL
ncbi:MAG: TonB-dependent receptor [Bacteroidaceae bacterium]|nr:TonB-dependent receptor [Bacteroidaceae bacterium]